LRRERFGELVQIDGSDHRWFEDRGDRCTLLVFIDDATSRPPRQRFQLPRCHVMLQPYQRRCEAPGDGDPVNDSAGGHMGDMELLKNTPCAPFSFRHSQ